MDIIRCWQSMISALSTPTEQYVTIQDLVKAALEDCSQAEQDELYSDSCYYYESKEGPYDYIVEQALIWGIIDHDSVWGYRIGRSAHTIMV